MLTSEVLSQEKVKEETKDGLTTRKRYKVYKHEGGADAGPLVRPNGNQDNQKIW